MVKKTIVKSTCEMCFQGCGVLIHLENNGPVGVAGNPHDPVSRGAICAKGAASLEYLNHPLRLRYPVQRAGGRGEGKWRRISWDEALDTMASQLTRIKEEYGAESVAFIRGGARGYQDSYIARFANVFGSPNLASMAPQCYFCRVIASTMTYGFMALPDYEFPPALILMWGFNPRNTAVSEWRQLTDALKQGSRLIVIDPWKSDAAEKADIWVKPRPGTDLALALGMLKFLSMKTCMLKISWRNGREASTGLKLTYSLILRRKQRL